MIHLTSCNTIFISLTGERLAVNGEIVNSSTRKIVPKYIIYQKQSFFAGGQRAVHTTQILKDKGEPLVSSTRENLSKVLVLPTEINTTIQNCRILKVEYRLKVGARKKTGILQVYKRIWFISAAKIVWCTWCIQECCRFFYSLLLCLVHEYIFFFTVQILCKFRTWNRLL